ncbi:MAG: hypothetical protein QOH36_79 [Actinomycetota bacterium]|jgi:hypothetical protein|nr:hypothetical protein [Actinomycetota bacterium]
MSGAIQALEIDGSGPTAFRRTLSLLLPIFLLAALMMMVGDRADASTAGAGVAATAVASSGAAGAASQFSISAIVCPILLFLRAAFGPFFAGLFDSLLAAFGCITQPSG